MLRGVGQSEHVLPCCPALLIAYVGYARRKYSEVADQVPTSRSSAVVMVPSALVLMLGSACALLPSDLAASASRRAVLSGAASATLLPLAARAAQPGVPEGMKTSESYTNLQQIAPEVTGTLGAGTMSSRSRPVTGIVLLEEVQESGKKDAPTVAAELVLDGGVAADMERLTHISLVLAPQLKKLAQVSAISRNRVSKTVREVTQVTQLTQVTQKSITFSTVSRSWRGGDEGESITLPQHITMYVPSNLLN